MVTQCHKWHGITAGQTASVPHRPKTPVDPLHTRARAYARTHLRTDRRNLSKRHLRHWSPR